MNVPDVRPRTCEGSPSTSLYHQIPETWEYSTNSDRRFILETDRDEYKFVVNEFNKRMNGKYSQIVQIERIQNKRWYMQYLAHRVDFKKRLNMETEKLLFHGCPEQAAKAIIEDCFNRSFAGVNVWLWNIVLILGTAYGYGVYFSANAIYSHGYARPNSKGEKFLFLSRVLIGKVTSGNSTMKARPVGI
ncbi:unnamed protein product [Didymodactylos carnosus]|uniref:Poly [ADP-ribose] polymerase n=1 Tax=Didymodactylos carnosus TaxID=1234261 RepID=A0A816DEC4_9BILA|nr:unnamed protein product [Didymodactylos carnosus]CAF1633272.1 unnamed protein product [Didymodactylos carnosus]CAF4274264.1 unnamed protein product [Didymodactylos carnosus]CAF4535350.1 unnamed protein product [Didymodactylos carnosus]